MTITDKLLASANSINVQLAALVAKVDSLSPDEIHDISSALVRADYTIGDALIAHLDEE